MKEGDWIGIASEPEVSGGLHHCGNIRVRPEYGEPALRDVLSWEFVDAENLRAQGNVDAARGQSVGVAISPLHAGSHASRYLEKDVSILDLSRPVQEIIAQLTAVLTT